MTHIIELEQSVENCYDNHYKSNVISSFMAYMLSFGLIMMGYMCHFYISLYAEELRKQTKIMTDLIEYIETPFSENESKELSEGSESESDELSEEDSDPSEGSESEDSESDEPLDDYDLDEPDKIMQEHTDDIREIMNHIFSSMNMGLNQT